MKSALNIIFNTKKGLLILDDEFEDVLYRKSVFIYIVYGLVIHVFQNGIPEKSLSYWYLFELIMGVLISILFGLIASFVLYKIGKWIGGEASSIEVFSLLSYANIPIIIGLVLVWGLRDISIMQQSINSVSVRNLILFVSWGIYIKILIMGIIKFNKYSFKKGVINISPIILINIIFYVLKYI